MELYPKSTKKSDYFTRLETWVMNSEIDASETGGEDAEFKSFFSSPVASDFTGVTDAALEEPSTVALNIGRGLIS